MAGITLARADIALFSDAEATRVVLPRVTAFSRARRFDQALVRFEGDQQPTPFRGEGRPRSIPLTVLYFSDQHAELAALVALFEAAQDASDARLLLRVPIGLVDDLNAIEVVTVDEVTESAGDGRSLGVSFVANTVAYTIEV